MTLKERLPSSFDGFAPGVTSHGLEVLAALRVGAVAA